MHAGTGGASLKPRRTSSFDSAASGGFRCECVLRSILTDWQLFFLLLVRAPCGKILRGRLDSLGGSIPPLLRLRATRHCRMTRYPYETFSLSTVPGPWGAGGATQAYHLPCPFFGASSTCQNQASPQASSGRQQARRQQEAAWPKTAGGAGEEPLKRS
jgi:hypothetical protein